MYPDPSDSMHIIDAQRFIEAWIQRQDKNGKVEGRQVEKWKVLEVLPSFGGLGNMHLFYPFFVFGVCDVVNWTCVEKRRARTPWGCLGFFHGKMNLNNEKMTNQSFLHLR